MGSDGVWWRGGFTLDVQPRAGFVFKPYALGGALSDSAHQGDAARLEAALERIVQALHRAATQRTLASGLAPPERGAAPAGIAPWLGGGPAVPGSGDAVAGGDLRADVGNWDHPVDLEQIGFRLDGLIADLRGALGEAGVPIDQPGAGIGA